MEVRLTWGDGLEKGDPCLRPTLRILGYWGCGFRPGGPELRLNDKSPVFISQLRYNCLGRMEYMVYPDGEQLS